MKVKNTNILHSKVKIIIELFLTYHSQDYFKTQYSIHQKQNIMFKPSSKIEIGSKNNFSQNGVTNLFYNR